MSDDLITPSGQEAFQDLQKRRLKSTTLSRFGYFLAPFGKQRVPPARSSSVVPSATTR